MEHHFLLYVFITNIENIEQEESNYDFYSSNDWKHENKWKSTCIKLS